MRAIVRTIFTELSPCTRLLKDGAALELCGAGVRFVPRRQAWAREGLAEKWLQCVSDYWFAEAELRDVRLDGAEGVRFTFYLDPEEPWHSSMSNPSSGSGRACHPRRPSGLQRKEWLGSRSDAPRRCLTQPCHYVLTTQELGGPPDECQPRSHPVQFYCLKP